MISETPVQPTNEIGISNVLSTSAYLLFPGLRTPHKLWKTYGSPLARILHTHKLSQTTSIHAKNQYNLTPPTVAYGVAVAPTIMGIAIRIAKGIM